MEKTLVLKDAEYWRTYRLKNKDKINARRRKESQVTSVGLEEKSENHLESEMTTYTKNWIEKDGKRFLWSERRGHYIEYNAENPDATGANLDEPDDSSIPSRQCSAVGCSRTDTIEMKIANCSTWVCSDHPNG